MIGSGGRGGWVGDEVADCLRSQVERGELAGQHLWLFPFELVDDAEKCRDVGIRDAMGLGEIDPRLAVGDADHEISCDEPEGEHRFDGEGDEFGVGCWAGFAENIDVELVELASAAFLGCLVAEALADFEPLDGFREIPLVFGGEAGE